MTRFQPGQSAVGAHHALKTSIATMDRARGQAVLWFAEILRRRLYRKLGFSSMNMYAKQELGFSEGRASDFTRLACLLEERPLIRAALAAEEIGWTKALDIARVCDAESEKEWLDLALSCSRRELAVWIHQARNRATADRKRQPELLPVANVGVGQGAGTADEVQQPQTSTAKTARTTPPDTGASSGQGTPQALPLPSPLPPTLPRATLPVKVTLEFTPEQFALYEALWARLQTESRAAGLAALPRSQAVLEIMARFLEESGPRSPENSSREEPAAASSRPPVQLHVHHCPQCGRTTVPTGRGELPITPATAERVACDAVLVRPGHPNRSAVPPRVRREVLARDRHRCRRPGCGHAAFLEVHHIVPRRQGGGNNPENLITLCSACHQLVHEKKWEPAGVVREGPPRYLVVAG